MNEGEFDAQFRRLSIRFGDHDTGRAHCVLCVAHGRFLEVLGHCGGGRGPSLELSREAC